MINLRNIILVISCVVSFLPVCFASDKYKTDLTQLNEQKVGLFIQAQRTLDDWSGEYEKLTLASAMIDSFIKTDPDFLPIYIEKARLLIMMGYTGNNNFIKANKDALEILSEVQRKDSAYAKSYVLAGHAYVNINDFENARKSLERAKKLKTSDPWLYNNWADLLSRSKEYDKAVQYATKAMILSNDNVKALLSAIAIITKYSRMSPGKDSYVDIPKLILKSFNDPQQRLRIADRLINSYGGNADILNYAYAIISAQKAATPNLPEVDFEMAKWLLSKGYRVTINEVRQFNPELSSAAEKILNSIKVEGALNDRIFSEKVDIALSDNDLQRAKKIINDAERNGINNTEIRKKQALLKWLEKDYASVIAIYEALAMQDPSYEGSYLLMASYSAAGRPDKLATYHKMMVEKNPTSAWTLGNYAAFLLYTMSDVDGAILYGERAIAEMPYSLASSTTSLAYLIKASLQFDRGDTTSAQKSYVRATAIGFDRHYVEEHCGKYCNGINRLWRINIQRQPGFST